MSDAKKTSPVFGRRSLFGGFSRRAAAFVSRQGESPKEAPIVVKPGELAEHKPQAIQSFLARLAENNARRKG